jgi:PAS domain S-box-containing protein
MPTAEDRNERTAVTTTGLTRTQLAGIVEVASDAIICIDTEQRLTFFNRAAETIFGYRAAEVLGRPLDVLIPEPLGSAHRDMVEGFGASGATTKWMGKRQEIRGVRKNGEEFPAEASISIVVDGGRRIYAAVLRDITERKRAEQSAVRLIEAQTARASAEAAERRATFLSEASAALSSSLDVDQTLDRLARLSVPVLGDFCIIDVVGEDDVVRRAHNVHADPASEALLHDLARFYPPGPTNERTPAARAIHSGEPVYVADLTDAFVAASSHDAEHERLLRSLAGISLVSVPLVARSNVLGALTVVMSTWSGRRHTKDDVEVVSDLAGRAALAMDNAWLYRKAEQARKEADEARALLDSLFESAPVGWAFIDRELRYRRVNGVLARIDGQPPEQMIGRTVHEIVPELARTVEPLLRRVLDTGESVTAVEITGSSPSDPDNVRHWLCNYNPIRTQQGEVSGVGVVVLDVTERSRAEERIRESERRFREIAENVREVFWTFDPEFSRTLYVNPAFERVWGRPLDEIRENPVLLVDSAHPADRASVARLLERLRSGEHALDYRIVLPDGTVRWVRAHGTPVRGPDGTVERIVGVTEDVTQQKEYETALARHAAEADLERRRLRAVLDLLPVGVWIAEADGRIAEANPAAQALWGGRARIIEIRDHDPSQQRAWWPDGRVVGRHEWGLARAVERGETSGPEEIEIATHDGTRRTILDYGVPIRSAAGGIEGGVALGIDISERKAGERALRRAYERLELLFRSARRLLAATRPATLLEALFADLSAQIGIDLYISRRVEESADGPVLALDSFAGLSAEIAGQIARLPVGTGLCGRAARDRERRLVEDVQASDDPDTEIFRSLGVRAYVCHPLIAGGKLVGTLAFGIRTRDRFAADDLALLEAVSGQVAVTIERVRNQEAERFARTDAEHSAERLRRLQALTAALAEALSPTEVFGVILERGLVALGADAAAVIELDDETGEFSLLESRGFPENTVDPRTRVPIDAAHPIREVARTKEPVFIESMDAWKTRYGEVAEFASGGEDGAFATLPLRGTPGLLGALTLSFTGRRTFAAEDRDFMISLASECAKAIERARLYEAERMARAAAEAASLAKSQFLAVMSHELRTPLTAIIGNADLVAEGIWGPVNAKQAAQLGRVKASAWHLVTIIDEILTYARTEAGKEIARLVPVDVVELASETLSLLEVEAAGRGIDLKFHAPAGDWRFETDPGKLRQILLNLVGNALKFTDEGEVALTVETTGPKLLVHVRDTGDGIAPEHVDRIFEPFWQVDQTTTRRQGGTGLGLPVSRRLARLLGGDVTVSSTVGEGSTFTVHLPIQPTQQD